MGLDVTEGELYRQYMRICRTNLRRDAKICKECVFRGHILAVVKRLEHG